MSQEINLSIEEFARLLMNEARLYEGENGRYWALRRRKRRDQIVLELDQLAKEQIICQGLDYFQRYGRNGVIIAV